MKKHKTILYIGNDNSERTGYINTMHTLSCLLEKEEFTVIRSSNKKNMIIRLLDMCFSVIKHRKKVDYILIDTFSTLNFYYALCVSQIARMFSIKYIPILHGGNLPSRIAKSSYLAKRIFKNSYKNVSPSNYLKNAFEKEGYQATFIPNILELEEYQFKKREALKPRLLWVRAFKNLYNPLLAIEVLKRVKGKFPDAKLCMIGPIKDTSIEDVRKKIKENDLENDVEITGVMPKKEWHKKSLDFDIIINTTNFDNTPVSIMEAMALGLTVVSTNVGGLPYLIDDAKDGFLVEKENPEAMATVIINLIGKENNEITSNARNKVESFGWNVVKNKWFEILE